MNNVSQSALNALANGKIIAYPTESTWGLGVDATNQQAVYQLNQLKQRPGNKSFIVLTHSLDTLTTWINWSKIPNTMNIMENWPGPITKLVPTSEACPEWLSYHGTIAIRISAHATASALCQAYNKPIISTSANTSGKPPLDSSATIKAHFGPKLAYCVPGSPGGLAPTRIIDLISGKIIR